MKYFILIILAGCFLISCHKTEQEVKFVYPKSSALDLKPLDYDYNKTFAKNLVLKKYGFEFEIRGGCIPLDSFTIDSFKLKDALMYQVLEKKYGKNWIQKLSQDTKLTYMSLTNINTILDTLDFVKKKRKQFELVKHDFGFDYELRQNKLIARAYSDNWRTATNSENNFYYSPFQITFDVANASMPIIEEKVILISNNELDY